MPTQSTTPQRFTAQEYTPTARAPITGNKVETAHASTANFDARTFFLESEASRRILQQDCARYVHRHRCHNGCC